MVGLYEIILKVLESFYNFLNFWDKSKNGGKFKRYLCKLTYIFIS